MPSKANLGGVLTAFFTFVLMMAVANAPALADSSSKPRLKFGGATGGIIRAPNTNQDLDKGNAFAEAWLKLDVELWRQGDTVLKAFVLGNYVRDTKPFAYNNTTKGGVGISLATRPNDNLEITFSARYDWFRENKTAVRRQGWRCAIDYYYYKRWEQTEPKMFAGMSKRANVLKSYGTLAYPGSLIPGDKNVVLTLGAEYSAEYQIPDSKLLFIPFIDTHFSWDNDGNNYNNKLIPAVGVKLRKPIKNGEIFFGVKYEVDYRWVDKTVRTGPMIFAGWYKGF